MLPVGCKAIHLEMRLTRAAAVGQKKMPPPLEIGEKICVVVDAMGNLIFVEMRNQDANEWTGVNLYVCRN